MLDIKLSVAILNLSVTILGAGHGGLAAAGLLARRGHRVTLWNRSPERIAPMAAGGGVRLTEPGSPPVLVPLTLVTSDLAAALERSRRVLVAVPATGHADVARACAPHLRDGQTVLLLPGRTGGALAFRRALREAGCRARLLLGEANTFPLAARTVGPAEAVVFGAKAEVLAAALPATRTPELLAAWQPVLPMLCRARSVLETGLANVGAILHPVITLLNASRIARGEAFDFYTEGVTPQVAAALEAADAERLSIADAFGVPAESLPEWVVGAYGHRADTVREAVGGNPAYVGIKAPTTLLHRYLLEDVPTGLVPLVELGRGAGLSLPVLGGLVGRARAVLGGACWPRPRTLAELGLEGLDAEAVREFVERGLVSAYPAAPAARFIPGLELVPQGV
jgi:opine dehydrogenase